ncbi:hypothetical protein B5807_09042 [Epicoccum nigrum]|uniref:Uncharacterized protein n=1 Tax=Epicoccum nigrum TaxID=105696 RepID=A0A1Y2LTC2_EPING|nr:hypothetical protein B5807_09042 [Epicoccum nigrum]
MSLMRMSVVVCHMRVLDSYSDWLWTWTCAKPQDGKTKIGRRAFANRRLGISVLVWLGQAPRTALNSPGALAAGHEASVKREEKAAARGRCRSTIITEETHPSCASSAAL